MPYLSNFLKQLKLEKRTFINFGFFIFNGIIYLLFNKRIIPKDKFKVNQDIKNFVLVFKIFVAYINFLEKTEFKMSKYEIQ